MTSTFKKLLIAIFVLSASTAMAAFPKAKESVEIKLVTSSLVASVPEASETQVKSVKEFKAQAAAEMKKGKYGGSGGKSKTLAAVLAIFLGSLGVHSFYMGQTQKGLIQLGGTALGLVLFITGIAGYISGSGVAFPTLALLGYLLILGVSIWAFVDFIRILTGALQPEEGFDS